MDLSRLPHIVNHVLLQPLDISLLLRGLPPPLTTQAIAVSCASTFQCASKTAQISAMGRHATGLREGIEHLLSLYGCHSPSEKAFSCASKTAWRTGLHALGLREEIEHLLRLVRLPLALWKHAIGEEFCNWYAGRLCLFGRCFLLPCTDSVSVC